MVAYDYSVAPERPAYSENIRWTLKRFVDFTKTIGTATDVWTIAHIPANQFLMGSYCARVTAAGAGCTVTVGSVTNAHAFEANLDVNGTGYIAINDLATPEFYPAVDTITMLINNTNAAAQFWLVFDFIDLSDSANHRVNQ